MCPWGLEYGRFGGHFVSWDRFCGLGTQPRRKIVLAVTRRHRSIFGNVLAHRTAFMLRNFLMLTSLGGFTRFFRGNCDLLVFRGVRVLREIPGPNRQTNLDPKKMPNFFSLLRVQHFQVRNGPETLKKWIFPVLAAVLGETPADQI